MLLKHVAYMNEKKRTVEKAFDLNFDVEEKEKYVKTQLGNLAIHIKKWREFNGYWCNEFIPLSNVGWIIGSSWNWNGLCF